MRTTNTIQKDIVSIKAAIKDAMNNQDEREAELLYEELDELLEELHLAQTTAA